MAFYKTCFEKENADRIRRAKSWLKRAEEWRKNPEMENGSDEEFLFLWIAFNAAYGSLAGPEDGEKEWKCWKGFIEKVMNIDSSRILKALSATEQLSIMEMKAARPIDDLLKNPYVYAGLWQKLRTGKSWFKDMEDKNKTAKESRLKGNRKGFVIEILYRLYTLRHQIVHGGKTYGNSIDSSWGAKQLQDGCKIMRNLVPAIVEIIEKDIKENPATPKWGKIAYPRFRKSPHQ